MLEKQVAWRNYTTLLKNPVFMFNMIKILFTGISGILPGIIYYFRTGKIDSIPIEIIRSYRKITKNRINT